ncbi:hypothetical protein WBP06_14280 [Novosphingobium sp. BL-8H]|uniref:hypothetical protein n=1 Tax=Novosphingobium sp. BL-8H TaxID=3127640 RepID=UPI0037575596
MSLAMLLPIMMVPPPVAGDDRTAILFAANEMLAAIASGKQAEMQRTFAADGTTYVLDLRGTEPSWRVRPNADLVGEPDDTSGRRYAEKIGVPTVLQRGDLAQVWAPYVFSIDGKNSHCGIDNFTIVRREGKWMVANLSYTVEPLSACAGLHAPESTQ